MEFRLHGSKSIRGSSSSTQMKFCKKCPPFGLSVQADLHPWKIGEYFTTPRSSKDITPSSTDNAHPKDLRRAYLDFCIQNGASIYRLPSGFRQVSVKLLPEMTNECRKIYCLQYPLKINFKSKCCHCGI